MPIELLSASPALFVAWIGAILLSLAFHEYAHAYVAYRLGDDTAASAGRLTLNPFAHVDIFGLLFLVFVGFGWGKPVPVNEGNLRNRRWGPLWVALAGPFSNVLLGVVIGVAARFIGVQGDLIGQFVFLVVFINFVLAVFNLLPIPPLDGSSIIFAFLPERLAHVELWLRQRGIWLLLALVLLLNITPWSPFTGLYGLAERLLGAS